MRPFPYRAALACGCALLARPALAASDPAISQIRDELKALEQGRLDDERRIQDLEARLRAAEQKAQNAEAHAASAEAQAQAQIQAAVAAPAVPSPAEQGGAPSNANAFNPAIGVVLDGKFGATQRDPRTFAIAGFPKDETMHPERGFFLGESELNANANVDDLFFGNLTASLEERDGNVDVSLEEAFIQTLAMPYGLQVTAGRFFSAIGYLNAVHAHADDFADRPLAYQAFLADQYGDDGLRLTWLAPTPFFLQFGAEGFRGTSFPAQGARHNGVGTKTVFAKVGGDIGEDVSWQGGLSYFQGGAASRETGDLPDVFRGQTELGVAHLVVKWAPGGNPVQRNLKFQTEIFREHPHGLFDGARLVRTSYGLYGQLVYQFLPQWRVGYRYDWLTAGGVSAALAGTTVDDQGHDAHRHSLMVEYDHSEFSRIRLQYNRDESRPGHPDNQGILQYTVSMGAHGAHAF
ncbi:MAG TPA: TonB-dependent receptor [Phenylobacterium sp.]